MRRKLHKLIIFVCENYIPEFEYIVNKERIDDVELVSFPSFCDGGFTPSEIFCKSSFQRNYQSHSILFCSQKCPAPRKDRSGKEWFQIIEYPYCYSNLIEERFCRFFAEDGYYVVSLGWLNDWATHLKRQGFTKENASGFFKSWCRKILYLDSGVDNTGIDKLDKLSAYLEIPHQTLPVDLEHLSLLIKKNIYSWKMKHILPGINSDKQLRRLQEENANVAAILNIISKITIAQYKRDVISILDNFWLLIFGATRSHYWPDIDSTSDLPDHIRDLDWTHGQLFILDDKVTTFYALLNWGEDNYGVIEVGGFLFPQNVNKYKFFFDSVIKIATLAISNAQRYEDLVASRNKYEYISYHDDLTGLYNRSYYKKLCSTLAMCHPVGVFVIDVDGLKKINDTQGHSIGDVLIQTAANIIRRSFRSKDAVIRLGGDEFVVIIEDCDEQLVETLHLRLQENMTESGKALKEVKLSMSIGYAVTESSEDSLEDTVHKADCKMYEHKRTKKY